MGTRFANIAARPTVYKHRRRKSTCPGRHGICCCNGRCQTDPSRHQGRPAPDPQFRGQPSQVIVIDGVPYVIDCGSGVADRLVLAGIRLPELRHVFVTHHHSDHVLDYGNLLLLAWASGLRSQVDTWGPTPLAGVTRLVFALNQVDIDIRIADEGRPDPRPRVHAHGSQPPVSSWRTSGCA